MNRINHLFNSGKKNLLSVYFCAGHPTLDGTTDIIHTLEQNGIDMVQIGIPSEKTKINTAIFQEVVACALKNGMTLKLLFGQLQHIRRKVNIPLLLSGCLDTITDFGFESFCRKCVECDIDGIVISDLALEEYQKRFRIIADRYGLLIILPVTPEMHVDEIGQIDKHSSGFIYLSTSSVETNENKNTIHYKRDFLKKMRELKLNNSLMANFDIHSKSGFQTVCEYATGVIIDNCFIELLNEEKDAETAIKKLVQRLKK
ncbi:Tryptophan synthase alpha chain [termite gut metagenome]|uniref:tryptophan synthase n=1 Tax=termite gut metagenome TaxID=433724 RepID=A0A5J4SV81_9ZZZZ